MQVAPGFWGQPAPPCAALPQLMGGLRLSIRNSDPNNEQKAPAARAGIEPLLLQGSEGGAVRRTEWSEITRRGSALCSKREYRPACSQVPWEDD